MKKQTRNFVSRKKKLIKLFPMYEQNLNYCLKYIICFVTSKNYKSLKIIISFQFVFSLHLTEKKKKVYTYFFHVSFGQYHFDLKFQIEINLL